jgi:hypothetical protein
MSIKLGIAVFALATALATTAYAASKGGGSHGGGGSHSGGSHGGGGHSSGGHSSGGSHGGSSHASKGGEKGSKGKSGKEAKHHGRGKGGKGHGWDDGRVFAGFAGAYRNGLFWLAWPFAYYATPDQLALSCSEDVKDVASLPVEQFGQAVQPTGDAAAALDDLGLNAAKGVQGIKIACPGEMPLTAPGRMAAMQRRIEAMLAALDGAQAPLDKFYGSLNDEQKAHVNAIGGELAQKTEAEYAGDMEGCGPAMLADLELPAADIDRAVHLTDPQRASLVALQNTDTQAAADLLKATCGSDRPITPTGRLMAEHRRLEVMLDAAKSVGASINDFYGTLSDEQKAKLEAIGPILVGDDEPEPEVVHGPVVHRIGPPPIGAIIRQFVPFR